MMWGALAMRANAMQGTFCREGGGKSTDMLDRQSKNTYNIHNGKIRPDDAKEETSMKNRLRKWGTGLLCLMLLILAGGGINLRALTAC